MEWWFGHSHIKLAHGAVDQFTCGLRRFGTRHARLPEPGAAVPSPRTGKLFVRYSAWSSLRR